MALIQPKLMQPKQEIVGRTKGGSTMGAVIGGTIGLLGGAALGTLAAPGFGTAAGAKTGALIGGAMTGALGAGGLGSTMGGLLGEKLSPASEGRRVNKTIPFSQMMSGVRLTPQEIDDPQTYRKAILSLGRVSPQARQEVGPSLIEAYGQSLMKKSGAA